MANRLEGKGTYDTGGGVVVGIQFTVTQAPSFNAGMDADYLSGNWGATMPLAPGAYRVSVAMTTTTDGKDRVYTFPDPLRRDATVK